MASKLLLDEGMYFGLLKFESSKCIGLSLFSEPLIVSNSSLGYLQGTLGYSYMCRQEMTLTVGQNFSLNTFHLQVQPFGVSGNEFGAGTLILKFFYFLSCLSPFCAHLYNNTLIT